MTLDEWLSQSREPITSLAIRCGVHPATVLRWKNGQRRPRPRQMAALTRATHWEVRAQDFGIDAHWGTPYFLSRYGDPPSTEPASQEDSQAPLPAVAPSSGAKASASRPPGLAEAQAPFASEARALGLDPDAIAAAALKRAISDEKARRWAEKNREAIEAYNRYFEESDTPLAKYRAF